MYSEALWEHYQQPYHRGRPDSYDHRVRQLNPICPDVLELFLCLREDRMVGLYFFAEACPPVIAAASLLCQWADGRKWEELATLTEQDLQRWLGPLPRHKGHALPLLVRTIRELEKVCRQGCPMKPGPEGV